MRVLKCPKRFSWAQRITDGALSLTPDLPERLAGRHSMKRHGSARSYPMATYSPGLPSEIGPSFIILNSSIDVLSPLLGLVI